MNSIKIVLFCIFTAITYGIVHDSVTTRVCIEYFTIYHPTLVETTSPTLLSILWGTIATWWVGLGLGIPLVLVSRWGPPPRFTVFDLSRQVWILLAAMGCVSFGAGIAGYSLAIAGMIRVSEPWDMRIPPARHALFLADLWAHNAAYASGILGGLVVMLLTYRRRVRMRG